ncbi:MAG: nuclear transport factor 2 family protein [Hyphomonadaceae bacterium]|nr:nuclear transport factor 2 family protein [Hyphomonadaceae bacterium]
MMRTDNLARNDLPAEAFAWYLRYLQSIDDGDLGAYAEFLDDGCEMYMNNDGPIAGKAAILGMLGPYWKSFAAMEHDLLTLLGDERCHMLEALNHYVRHDGRRVSVRAVAVTQRNADGFVTSVRVYADPAPVFAPMDNAQPGVR